MARPQRQQPADEALQVGEGGGPLPVHPRGLVVLVVGVVVATLGPPELVTHGAHRHPVRQGQQAPGVAQLPPAQLEHLVRRAVVALPPAVPRAVVVGAVVVAVPVGLVVLAVVGDEVVQREPVVTGHEVDAVQRGGEEVGAALDPQPQRLDHARLGPQEAADVVTEAVVPLQPPLARPGRSQLVATGGVPRLGDHAHPAFGGPPSEAGDQPLGLAEHRRQIEAEAVDAEVGEHVERPQHEVSGGG